VENGGMTKPDALSADEWTQVQRAIEETSKQWSSAYRTITMLVEAMNRKPIDETETPHDNA
jgi:hypothetical protein